LNATWRVDASGDFPRDRCGDDDDGGDDGDGQTRMD